VRHLGLRSAITTSYVVGALTLALVLALGTWTATSQIMLRQRLGLSERLALTSAYQFDLAVADGMTPVEALDSFDSGSDTQRAVDQDGQWVALPGTNLTREAARALPEGEPVTWSEVGGVRATLARVALPNGNGSLYELTRTTELNGALGTLSRVLWASGIVTALGGIILGQRVAGRVLSPLRGIGAAAEEIGRGDLSRRLKSHSDPDLAPIVYAFNAMVDGLDQRIQRDARFAADVSHELRTPLTTLVASVDLMNRRRDLMDDRAKATLDLMQGELERFRGALEDLIDLGRLEDGAAWVPEPVDLTDLAIRAAVEVGLDPHLVASPPAPVVVGGDRGALLRAVRNLLENAQTHGGGPTAITVSAAAGRGHLAVVDAGPGVPERDRGLIFERFKRGGARGDLPGSGLGLSIVAETMRRAGGEVRHADAPGGGSVFTLTFPRAAATDG